MSNRACRQSGTTGDLAGRHSERARQASTRELDTLLELYRSELARFEHNPEIASEALGKTSVATADQPRLAAWFSIANVLLNLDETITKG